MENIKSKQPFILTTDVDTKDTLLNLGFTLMSEDNNKYIFLNDSVMKFDENGNEVKLNKMCYTNIMCMEQS